MPHFDREQSPPLEEKRAWPSMSLETFNPTIGLSLDTSEPEKFFIAVALSNQEPLLYLFQVPVLRVNSLVG